MIGFLGSGNMAEALIKGLIRAKVFKADDIVVSDIRSERVEQMQQDYGVASAEDNAVLAQHADILVLSVKPQNMDLALESIKDSLKGGVLVISIVAGVKVEKIQRILGDVAIIRVMPNTPALVDQGASVLFPNHKAQYRMEEAKEIFRAVGKEIAVQDEKVMDGVTALSGSGPAYFFLLMEEMIKAGIELGLDEQLVDALVLQTAKGAAVLAQEGNYKAKGPDVLRKMVTSPGGTTEAALKVFNDSGFSGMVSKAIKAACQRSIELSR